MVVDFTRATYLGLHHPSSSLEPWDRLTTGVLEQDLAELQGCEASLLARSTLHAAWDLFGAVAGRGSTVYVDEASYPILQWGAQQNGGGMPVHRFRHQDPASLWLTLRRNRGDALVLTDGYCPGCSRMAPVAEYLELVDGHKSALLVIDDTQAVGILGAQPSPEAPYGFGGGGSLEFLGIRSEKVVLLSSLAKGFGVPLACTTGSPDVVGQVRRHGECRTHASPPSAADIGAARSALSINSTMGDAIRRRLAGLVQRLHRRLASIGLMMPDSLFPVQSIPRAEGLPPYELGSYLESRGILGVVNASRCEGRPRFSLLLTAEHQPGDIDQVTREFARFLGQRRTSWTGT